MHCDATGGCCSFEWSPTENNCNLNKECFPTMAPYLDYFFCAKSGKVGNQTYQFSLGISYILVINSSKEPLDLIKLEAGYPINFTLFFR